MKKQIAIVEDDFLLALVMTKYLTNLGYQCHSFPSADDFFIFESKKPDLQAVILDVKLKGEKTGIQLFQQLASISNVPVIFSTGNSDHAELKSLNTNQVIGVLIKPISLEELKRLLDGLNNRSE